MRKSRFGRCTLSGIVLSAIALLPKLAEGQPTPPLAKDGARPSTAVVAPGDLPILTYDVGDMLLDVPDYPYPGSISSAYPLIGSQESGMSGMGGMGMGGMGGMMGGMGGGMMGGSSGPETGQSGSFGGGGHSGPGLAPHSARITIDDLKRVILTVIAPDTWAESGGQEGELQHLGTSLVIRQTAAVHEEIRNLLDQLRKGSGEQKTVSIDARWLLLNSDELERLMPPNEEGRPQIVRDVLSEFTRRPSSIRGQTNCFTGQLVYLVSGTRRNVITSFIPVVGSVESPVERRYAALPGDARLIEVQTTTPSRSVGYQPVINTPNLGVLLQIRPTLVPSEARAIVDLRSTLTVLSESSSDIGESAQTQEDSLVPKVDRVAIETQELATTLSVPLGEPVVAGGLTYIGPSAEAMRQIAVLKEGESAAEAPQLYLVLELK